MYDLSKLVERRQIMSIVKLKEVVKKYGDITAVDHIDLTIEQGEIYGLLGPNGAGKSTLIGIICDIVKKDSGEVVLFNQVFNKKSIHLKNDIGVVPQNIAIYNDLTAEENVSFFGSLYGLKKEDLKNKVTVALEFVGLLDHRKKKPKTFSGGMKRRLNIACAIVHQPKLIIMDEPTVGIDPQSKNHILNSVIKLNEMGSTIIYTTHLMEEAEFLCSRIGIIDHGKVIAEGTKEALQAIVTDKKRIMIKTGLIENPDSLNLSGIKGVLNVSYKEQSFDIECAKESDCISAIVGLLSENGTRILDIQMQGVSLETAFLSLTGRRLRD